MDFFVRNLTGYLNECRKVERVFAVAVELNRQTGITEMFVWFWAELAFFLFLGLRNAKCNENNDWDKIWYMLLSWEKSADW